MNQPCDQEDHSAFPTPGKGPKILRAMPTPAQIDMLQQMSQSGASFSEIAMRLNVPPALLRWWSQQQDEAGDALRLAKQIHFLRADLNI